MNNREDKTTQFVKARMEQLGNEFWEIAGRIEAAVVTANDAEKLIRAEAGLWMIIAPGCDVTEAVKASVKDEMKSASTETMLIDTEWSGDIAGSFQRAVWFVERTSAATSNFASTMENILIYARPECYMLKEMDNRLKKAIALYEGIARE